MIGFIDNVTATEEERRLARKWADYACRRFGEAAPAKLREGLTAPTGVKSRKALRIAIRRAEASVATAIAIATR